MVPISPFLYRQLLQEFRYHGVEMRGPCKRLEKTGCRGKFSSNIQRDMMRKVAKSDPMQARSCGQNS